MRLGALHRQGGAAAAVFEDDAAFLLPEGMTVEDMVAGGLDRALEIGTAARRGTATAFDAEYLALPYKPASIRDFVTFESHVEGVRQSIEGSAGVPDAWYDAPTFYFTNPHALHGPGESIKRPALSRALDFELEVGVVLGMSGSDLSRAEARAAIFGYTIVNDWSARDLQRREMQVGLGPAKGKDFATSIGPWIVTADELEPHRDPDGFLDLDCRVSVNGEPVGGDRLSHMGWTFEDMIVHASRDSVVLAGDLLASGTTGGGGCLAELWGRRGEQQPPPLEPGDRVEMTVEGIGRLVGAVAAA